MRSSKSRSRNKSNRQRTLVNVVNRVFDSSGPEGKVRGTPQQIIEKYLTLARDAQLSHDRVAEQSFFQHAEHYTRMLGEAQREQAERQQNQPHQRDDDSRDDLAGAENGNGQPQGGRNDSREDRREDRRDDRREDRRDHRREDRQQHARNQDRSDSKPESGLPPVISSDEAAGPVATPESEIAQPAPARPAKRAPAAQAPATPEAPAPEAPAPEAPAPEAASPEAAADPAPRRRTRAPSSAPRSRKKAADSGDTPAPEKASSE